MPKQKPTFKLHSIIRYWHPRKGGWYHATLVRIGSKWAMVEPLAAHNGIIIGGATRKRVPVSNVAEAVL